MNQELILVVEDDGIIASDIKRSLEKVGYQVLLSVSSGEEAIEIAKLHRPDLVLMDILLEGDIDGIEAAEQIKSILNIPIVYISSSADKHVIERAKRTEPFGYLIKPFEERTLLTTIDIALYKYKNGKVNEKEPVYKPQKHNLTAESAHRLMPTRDGQRVYNTSQAGLREGWTRATFILKTELLEQIKSLAYWDRKSIKTIVNEALVAYLKDKEVEAAYK
jgi:CheY-like chemotaxis protein